MLEGLFFLFSGLVGYARLCPGDQYEVQYAAVHFLLYSTVLNLYMLSAGEVGEVNVHGCKVKMIGGTVCCLGESSAAASLLSYPSLGVALKTGKHG